MRNEINAEHPHIVKVPGVLGGEPVIAGTRIGVAFIARLLQAGEKPSEVIAAHHHLAPAAVDDAISYYLDYRDEIDQLIADSTPAALAERYGSRSPSAGESCSRAREAPALPRIIDRSRLTPPDAPLRSLLIRNWSRSPRFGLRASHPWTAL
jgi:uncharacterized protein (DUF433 family)